MGRLAAWVIGSAGIIGLHVVLWEQWAVLLFLWGLAAIVSVERERRKAVDKLNRHTRGSWIDRHHEEMREYRAEHEAYRKRVETERNERSGRDEQPSPSK